MSYHNCCCDNRLELTVGDSYGTMAMIRLMATTCEESPWFSSTQNHPDDQLWRSSSTYTASLTSSITNYKYENGRRYHAYREGGL